MSWQRDDRVSFLSVFSPPLDFAKLVLQEWEKRGRVDLILFFDHILKNELDFLAWIGETDEGAIVRLRKITIKLHERLTESVWKRYKEQFLLWKEQGYIFTPWFSVHFPQQLTPLDSPPLGLWSSRPLPSLELEKNIAVIGSRRMSHYGREAARFYTRELVERYGLSIVSGCAFGVDQVAHGVALKSGGTTVGVLGSGLAHLSSEVRTLFTAEKAMVISEFWPSAPPDKWRFSFRNRLISGLSRVVLIVEAAERSGTMGTFRFAAEQGREVFVVSHPFYGSNLEGIRWLHANGARMAFTPREVAAEYFPQVEHLHAQGEEAPISVLEMAHTSLERQILQILLSRGGRGLLADIESQLSLISTEELMKALFSLQGRGVIVQGLGVIDLACMIQS